ncbi:hypothetical protein HNP24_001943 [Chryseobacterium sediminis]|uniref:HTH LytTR-type domain-containing protein n=1 Tax=Chryseobacterium sediminis TaxID=1679494 RepID=A0ABR6Q1K3_9FLAO|nr:LytTR family DNA-binding domain-containing protein [Chryseobacterium sediminis]MBB6330993.1 hypothetical protein [Chryseobacterium sediminis]
MTHPILNIKTEWNFAPEIRKMLMLLSGAVLLVVGLTIFQDFLESKRNGYRFYFSESLLFKTVWFLYIPMLMIVYKKLKSNTFTGLSKTTFLIVSAIILHIFILSGIATVISFFFFRGQYDLFKFLSYTITHDFYTLVIIYTGFVWGFRLISIPQQTNVSPEIKPTQPAIVINNGKDNVIIQVEDILQITSATPYVFIHINDKKHLHSETLKSMHEKLGSETFVRVHKSTLVNLSKVSSFKSRLNGDYDVQLTDGNTVRLSRTYSAEFKKRFHPESSGHDINSSG